jgi:ABC-type antimicrobial peptide transport system permease subunit
LGVAGNTIERTARRDHFAFTRFADEQNAAGGRNGAFPREILCQTEILDLPSLRVAPGRAVFGMRPLEQALAASLDQPRLNASALTIFAGAAMTLASLGLYSLLTLLVSERARELGVRLALGATAGQVVELVLRRAARLMAGGIAAGLILTLGVARVLRGVLFGVDPLDWLTLTAAVAMLIVFALAAAALPARRAAAIDPIETLRSE